MRRRAVVLGGDDVVRTIGQPGLLERTGAAEVVREAPTRFDILLQRLGGEAAVPEDVPASLRDWFGTMVTTAAGAEDVGLVVMSLRHELVGPEPWRHRRTGVLVEPPEDHATAWNADEIAWLHAECEAVGPSEVAASIESMCRVVELLQGRGATVLMLSVSTYDPTDTTFSYTGVGDTYALRAHRLIAEAQRLAMESDMGFVDVDRAIAELGAAAHVPRAGDFTDEAAVFITEEAIDAFDQAALFGASVQPDVMRLVVPAFDRRTEDGRIARWHIEPKTPIVRGDHLFDVLFEDLPLRVDHDEADRGKRRPTTGRRQTRSRTMTMTVVAASNGFVYDVVAGAGTAVTVGDTVALVSPVEPEHPLSLEDAGGDFRVATRRAVADGNGADRGRAEQ